MLNQLRDSLHEAIEGTQGTYGISIHHFESGESFDHNAEEPFFSASVIKVPIMAALFDAVHKGTASYDEKMTVRYEDQVLGSGLLHSLTPGLQLSLYDLAVLMIIDSDNTATNMLADRLGKEHVNACMREWGLEKSGLYNNLMIIPAKIENFNQITAGEMTHLLKGIAEGKIVSWNACREMVKIMKQQRYLDGIARNLPEQDGLLGAIPAWEIASKTGWTSTVTHDMGLLYVPGHTFAVSLLGRGMESRPQALELYGRIGRLLFDSAAKQGRIVC